MVSVVDEKGLPNAFATVVIAIVGAKISESGKPSQKASTWGN